MSTTLFLVIQLTLSTIATDTVFIFVYVKVAVSVECFMVAAFELNNSIEVVAWVHGNFMKGCCLFTQLFLLCSTADLKYIVGVFNSFCFYCV